MKQLIAIPLLVGACTVMVNGKPKRLGGGNDPTPTTATTPAPAAPTRTAQTQPATPPKAPPVARPLAGAATIIPVTGGLTTVPIVTRIDNVAFDTTYSKVHGNGNSPDCGNEITSAPIATLEIKQAVPAMHVALVGGSNDGFVLRRGDALWFACTSSIGQVPTITGLKEGWQPGRYDIYPISRYSKHAKPTFDVEIFDPDKPAVWSDGVKTVTIAQKLAAPMFVDVATKPNRKMLRAQHSGYGCDKLALPAEPDVALVIERPIPGLVVRPLPTAAPITLRREHRDAKTANKGCVTYERRSIGSEYTPSYTAHSELHFDRDDEGTYGISVGTPDEHPATVTLMIYDASTKLDAFAKFPITDTGSLDRRWLGLHFPQLDLRELTGTRDYAHAEMTARLFAAAPHAAFVYAKLDLDKDIASGSSDAFPKKNEPLLVLDVEESRVEVLAADGHRYFVKSTHVVLAPDGEPAILAAPRPLHKLDIGGAIALLPATAKSLVKAHETRIAARDKCIDRVWAPYGRQLPTITRPSGVDIVVYESARTKNIRAAGEAAVDRACGTDAASTKLTEAERVKMMVEVDKARVALLAAATASLRQ